MSARTPTDEFSRIDSIAKTIAPPSSRVEVGIGDDAAVVSATRHPLLLCTDAMVEGVHFDLNFISPRALGHKALASCLSDIAAMNGRPLHALFSLALPRSLPESFLTEFYSGAGALAQKFAVDIIGGDLTSSPSGIFIDVTCVGEAERRILRSGARPGDLIAVSGNPGASAAGLHLLRDQSSAFEHAKFNGLIRAHLLPTPRFDLLPALNTRPALCTAMIDISDGLSSELHHLAERSNVGVEFDAALVPLHLEARTLAASTGRSALEWALSGGEDYELLVTLDPEAVREIGHLPSGFTVIGTTTTPGRGVLMRDLDGRIVPIQPTGFDHFRTSSPGTRP